MDINTDTGTNTTGDTMNTQTNNDRRLNRRTTFDTMEEAQAACGPDEIVGDRGPYTWPRYTVITPPKVGDPVSSYFNGDSYPEGYVTKVSTGPAFRRVETSTGRVFWRNRNGKGSGWLAHKTWSLRPGHVESRNPHL